jgi:hypothetical protein
MKKNFEVNVFAIFFKHSEVSSRSRGGLTLQRGFIVVEKTRLFSRKIEAFF